MKKKILLLTASYGTGHLTSSRSINNSLLELYPEELETKTIDFVKTTSLSRSDRISEKIYNFSMQHFRLYHLVFNITNFNLIRHICDFIFPTFYNKVYRLLLIENPDLFITIHPHWNYLVDAYNKRMKKKTRHICVVTDSIRIHHLWITQGVDYYIVCDKDTKDVIANYNIDKDKIVVKGLPVDPGFSKQVLREKFLSELGLSPERMTFLVVIGLGDAGRFLKLIDYLTKIDSMKFQLVVVTGKYKNIYNKLINKPSLVPLKVVGWTDRMADFIKSSDLVISKSGGLTVMETLAAGKPVFIPVFAPGQERGNAELIKRYGFGFVENNFRKIKEILRELISKPELISEIQDRVKTYSKPNASKDIAEFVHKVIFEQNYRPDK
jgi:UDP-N-acetylglucosamine:LPS N-acetylglucosamine transferase